MAVVAVGAVVFRFAFPWVNHNMTGLPVVLFPVVVFGLAGALAQRGWLALWMLVTIGVCFVAGITAQEAASIAACEARYPTGLCDEEAYLGSFFTGVLLVFACAALAIGHAVGVALGGGGAVRPRRR